jgi:hypothetical protein
MSATRPIEMVHDTHNGNHFTVFSAATELRPKVRKTWGALNPVTRVKLSLKLYTRRPKFQKEPSHE